MYLLLHRSLFKKNVLICAIFETHNTAIQTAFIFKLIILVIMVILVITSCHNNINNSTAIFIGIAAMTAATTATHNTTTVAAASMMTIQCVAKTHDDVFVKRIWLKAY